MKGCCCLQCVYTAQLCTEMPVVVIETRPTASIFYRRLASTELSVRADTRTNVLRLPTAIPTAVSKFNLPFFFFRSILEEQRFLDSEWSKERIGFNFFFFFFCTPMNPTVISKRVLRILALVSIFRQGWV